MRETVDVFLERTLDGNIITGLREGLLDVRDPDVHQVIWMSHEGMLFPYEAHPFLVHGEPVRYTPTSYLFTIELMPNLRGII